MEAAVKTMLRFNFLFFQKKIATELSSSFFANESGLLYSTMAMRQFEYVNETNSQFRGRQNVFKLTSVSNDSLLCYQFYNNNQLKISRSLIRQNGNLITLNFFKRAICQF